MGNQGSALGDGDQDAAARQLAHFDHSYKAYLHTTSGPLFQIFGKLKNDKREVQLTCLADSFEVLLDALAIVDRKKCAISYSEIADVGWDHSLCEVKFNVKRADIEDSFVILHVPTSVELEHELKLRFTNMASSRQGVRIPPFMYVGMFAGSTKPKPFQRKRPNISKIPAGKLPQLQEMRGMAESRHAGSYAPCPPGSSRRIDLAVQHIFEGHNTFPITYVKGNIEYSNKWCLDSIFLVTDSKIVFHPNGLNGPGITFPFDEISHWEVQDLETAKEKNVSGITIYLSAYQDNPSKAEVYFGFKYIRDAKHTLEFFWNKHQVAHGRPIKLGSTHGRPLETVYTLSGEIPAPEAPQGQIEIVDSDGLVVRPGHMVKPGSRTAIIAPKGATNSKRRNSLGINLSNEAIPLPPETSVKNHWRSIVKHQGWLLKKGGVGVGSIKQWIKRYFVLYSTSQGHFLVYYSDILECPMYTTERVQRNVVDLAKTTFIRPGSNKDDGEDVPPFSFDIQTTEREWTLCAESQENVYKWLQMLTRAVDEDVAIIPDEDIEFKVKAKVDPLGVLNPMDYSTSLMVSANAVCVVAPDPPGSFNVKQQCFWVYTDFYKWSLLSQNGKLALLVNVFSDSTFSKRMEFIFRTKEAVRLATAIEFFIEKFMTAMHLQLELQEGAFDQTEDTSKVDSNGKLAHASAHEWEPDQVNQVAAEIDLLGFDDTSVTTSNYSNQDTAKDEFGLPITPSSNKLASSTLPPGPPPSTFNVFDDDPFGLNTTPSPPKNFGTLTSAQVEQHKIWYQAALVSSGGPFYDDGTLQIACKIEIRGSQGRLTLFYRNKSSSSQVTNLQININDPNSLLRMQVGPLQSNLSSLTQTEQQIMVECMTPVSPGPTISITYSDSTLGQRNAILSLPLLVVSFNEPLPLNTPDFYSRWGMLVGPGQQAVERFNTQKTAQNIAQLVSTVLKFQVIENTPQLITGAASLRTGTINPTTGEKVTLGCLIKIEINSPSNALQVTVRTVLPGATDAVIGTIKSLLSETN